MSSAAGIPGNKHRAWLFWTELFNPHHLRKVSTSSRQDSSTATRAQEPPTAPMALARY
jgi:hypothetical protein